MKEEVIQGPDFGLPSEAASVEPIKFQISSTKSQTNTKFQYQMTKTRFGILNFGHCYLFDI